MFLKLLEAHIALVNVAEKHWALLHSQYAQLSLGYETRSVKLFLIKVI